MPPNFKVFHQKRRYGKPLPPPPGLDWKTQSISFDTRPRVMQRNADLTIAHPIIADVCNAHEFWTAWLTHPPLSEFKLTLTPTYTSLGLHPSFMSFFEGYWHTVKEAIAGKLQISPALKSIIIQFTPDGHYVCADGCIETRTHGPLDLYRPTNLGDMIAGDMFESSGMYWPTIETVELPSQIVQAARHAYPEHLSQDFALGAACGISLRRMFPFANIIANGINIPDIAVVDSLLKVMGIRDIFEEL